MKNAKKLFLLGVIPFFILIASLFMFRLLYRYDNKYTRNGAQPICGVLSLSEGELAQDPLRYLIREWEFYPNVSFSPETFAKRPADTDRKSVV